MQNATPCGRRKKKKKNRNQKVSFNVTAPSKLLGNPIQTQKPSIQNVCPSNSTEPQIHPDNKQFILPEKLSKQKVIDQSGIEVYPGNPAQSIHSINSVQYVCPDKPKQSINQGILSSSDNRTLLCNNSGHTIQPNGQPRPAPMFRPSKETKLPEATSRDKKYIIIHPKSSKGMELLQNNNNPVITIIGKNSNRLNPMSQQKKILKFQMRIQSIQQEKQRQAKIQAAKIAIEHEVANVFTNPNRDETNPTDMPHPSGMPNPPGMPNAFSAETSTTLQIPGMPISPAIHNITPFCTETQMPNPAGIPIFNDVPHPASVHNVYGIPDQPGIPYFTDVPQHSFPHVLKYQNYFDIPNYAGLPDFTNMSNACGMPDYPGLPYFTSTPQNNNSIMPYVPGIQDMGDPNSMPLISDQPGIPNFTGATYLSNIFNVDGLPNQAVMGVPNPHANQNNPVVPMASVQQTEAVETAFHIDDSQRPLSPPAKLNVPQHPINRNPGPDMGWMHADMYGYKYPKGIPRSFLIQQQQQSASSNTASDAPIWPSCPPNAPTLVPPPAKDPNATSPLLVETNDQGDVQQPYSPSELFAELDQSGNQGSASNQTGNNVNVNRKQIIADLGRKYQAAHTDARKKFMAWITQKKPKTGPLHEEMLLSRKTLKSIKKIINSQKNIVASVAYGNLYIDEIDSSESRASKRLSVFHRLGPQQQTKKPKLTINLTVNDDQEVREVVDETEEQEEITPVHLRQNIILSTDETVMKYLKAWPWKKNVVVKKSVTARSSKTVMILEREQMEEIYERETLFIQVTVKDYPPTYTKEQVLDILMENIRGYSFIPCFIEFNQEECKFLTIRCRSALLSLHKCGFIIRKDDIQLVITISQTELTLNQLDFVPRIVLRKKLAMALDNRTKLNLSEFTLKDDISHFIYFPLNRLNNQSELVQMQSDVNWYNLTELNLSHNRISSLDGFDLEQTTPKLKHLNLSYNCIEKVTLLLKCRELPLNSIHLEGNPLCTNYTDPHEYVKVVKMMFPGVATIDDIPVKYKGEMPTFVRNYCPPDAKQLVEKFLETFFPLLDGDIEHRIMMQEMYEDNANLTITYHYKLAFGPIYRCFKPLFQNARQLEQDNMSIIKGSTAIVKSITSWPRTEHDPFTFTVDVLYQSDTTTILRVDGIFKLTREKLAEDEHLLAFSRTVVLHTRDYAEFKIQTEMIYWSQPTGPYAKSAFTVTAINKKQMNPKIDSTTDEKLQAELLKIFMKLTAMSKKESERCLEIKKWNLKEALDHFIKLLKLDDTIELTEIS